MLSLASSSRPEIVPIEGLEFSCENPSRSVARRPIITTDPESAKRRASGSLGANASLLLPIKRGGFVIINESGGIQGPQPIQPSHPPSVRKPFEVRRTPRPDRANISIEARLLDKLRRMPEVREEKIEALKREIAAGGYETEERLKAAIDRFFSDGLA